MKFIKHTLPSGDPWCWEVIGDKPEDKFFVLPLVDANSRVGYKVIQLQPERSKILDPQFDTFREAQRWLRETYSPKKSQAVS